MLDKAWLRVYTKVIGNRVKAGEDLETVLASYNSLSEEDKQQIRDALA
jgi:uncharacterized protein (DUF433 family)